MRSSLKKHKILAVIIFLLYVIGGASFYKSVEGWTYTDSFYFIAATFTTIGYGDVSPTTNTGKIFTIFFSFFGIAMFLYFITLFGKYFYKKVIKQEISRGKQNIKHDVEKQIYKGKHEIKHDIKKDIKEGKLKIQKEKKAKK